MKKTLLIILSSTLVLLAVVYTLAFTSIGNNLLKPTLEAKINESSPIALTLNEFKLTTNTFNILINLDEANTLLVYGSYSLFTQEFDVTYEVKLTDLSKLSELAQRNLKGELFSNGKVVGNPELFSVKGESDLAKSDTTYTLVLKEMQLNRGAIKLTKLDAKTLLVMLGEKAFSTGKIDLHLQINDLNPNAMKGSVVAKLDKANLNAKLIKKEFNLQLSKTALKSELTATLEGNKLKYLFELNSELANIYSKGKGNLATNAIDTVYKINIKELALLNSLTNTSLRGPFSTTGLITGDKKELTIKGKTNIASSDSTYNIHLKELNPSKVIVQIKNAKLDKLLYMTGQEKFASADINANIEFNNLNPKTLDGKATLHLSKGKINQTLMRKVFDLKLPKTNFSLKTDTVLNKDTIKYTLALSSNLAKINSKGRLKTEGLQTDASYRVDIKELALLKPLTDSPLRGPFATSGTVVGDESLMNIKGTSNLAASKTSYDTQLKAFKMHHLNLSIQNAQLDKLLYLIGEPRYAKGEVNLNTNLSTITPLNGKLILAITKGITNSKTIEKGLDIKLPSTKFNMRSDGLIKEDKLTAKTEFNSGLATLLMKKSEFNIKTSALKSDYLIKIPSLIKFEPLLERKLYGKFSANGEIIKDKKLTITAHSDIFKGKFNAKVVDENINADFTDLRALGILKMLNYPLIIDAPINGTLTYNTKSQQGKLDTKFSRAALQKTKMTNIVNAFTRTDLTKERFNEGSLISLINKDIIKSTVKMQSKRVTLNSKKFIINSKKQLIDARFALTIKKYQGDVLVKGDINKPKVKLDAKSMITPEVEEKVSKEINRFLNKLF